jgi:hypothetical protein
MSKNYPCRYARSNTVKELLSPKCSLTVAERKARKARKQLARLFPHLATRLHKGVSSEHLHRHAAILARRTYRKQKKP